MRAGLGTDVVARAPPDDAGLRLPGFVFAACGTATRDGVASRAGRPDVGELSGSASSFVTVTRPVRHVNSVSRGPRDAFRPMAGANGRVAHRRTAHWRPRCFTRSVRLLTFSCWKRSQKTRRRSARFNDEGGAPSARGAA